MIPIKQTITEHDPEKGIFGNCLQACVASLFELPIEEVPHFALFSRETWTAEFINFIESKGYFYEGWAPIREIDNPKVNEGVNGYLIVSGISPKGFRHAVIYKDKKLVHDPSPLNGGLVEELGFYLIKKPI